MVCALRIFFPLAIFWNILSPGEANLWQHLNKSNNVQQKAIEILHQGLLKYYHVPSTIRICIRATQKSHKETFSDSLDVILGKIRGIPVDLFCGENLHYKIHMRLYFVESLEALISLVKDERSLHRTNSISTFYTIILPPKIKDPDVTVEKMVRFCWKINFVNVNILVVDEYDFITFYTYYPYTPLSCNVPVPVVFKRFDSRQGEVEKFSLFEAKLKNFWMCPIKVLLWLKPPFVMFNHSRGGRIEPLSGMDGHILQLIAQVLNFTIEMVPLVGGTVFANESEVVLKILQEHKADLAIGNLRCSYKLTNLLCLSDTYYVTNTRAILRFTDTFSPLEILLFPFDLYTWLVIATFFIGRRVSRMLSKRSIGTLRTIAFHSRMYMFVYLFTYLMIRSAYEGSVFKYLHMRPMKPAPSSIDEAIKDGYRFVVDPDTYTNMEASAEINASLIVKNVPEKELISQLLPYDGKMGTFLLEDYITSYRGTTIPYREMHRFVVIREKIFLKLACIYLQKFSFLFSKLNKLLVRLRSHGLVRKFYFDFVNVSILRHQNSINRIHREMPSTLGMEELAGAFQMYFLFKGLCGVVFLLEVAVDRYGKLKIVMDVFH